MDLDTMRARASASRVGHLGTVGTDGAPHVVPVCFALVAEVAYSCVDNKPKRSARLRRLSNIRANSLACILVDAYDEDWSRLWWVRLDGRGRIVDEPTEVASALAALAGKYAQYAASRPTGPVLALDVTRISGWSAA